MSYNNGNYKINYNRIAPGNRRKQITTKACTQCKGRGFQFADIGKGFDSEIVEVHCDNCNGTGRFKKRISIMVKDIEKTLSKDKEMLKNNP